MPRRPNPLSPTDSPLALFGAEVRFLRDRAALTLDALGEISGYSGSYIGGVERAKEMPKREFAIDIDQCLEGNGALVRLWDGLLKPSVYPDWFDWPQHEADAAALYTFELGVVYGLLQTEAYAREMLYGDEVALAGRLVRQEILRSDEAPMVVAILDESVLWREVGTPEVMHDQLNHLVKMSSERLSIQIVRSERHRGVNGSFVLATLADRSEVAYIETAARGITTGAPEDLKALSDRFDAIRSRAMSVDQSLELIARTAEKRWT